MFAGTIYLGLLHGSTLGRAPQPEDVERREAIASVRNLYSGFIEEFGTTDCRTLTSCDFEDPQDVAAFLEEYRRLGPEHPCNRQIMYVVSHCHELLEEWRQARNDGC